MKTNLKLASAIAIFIAISGCETEKTELQTFDERPVQTVSWYKENVAERDAVLAYCKDNIGLLAKNPNCLNASASIASAFDNTKRIETPKAITFEKKSDDTKQQNDDTEQESADTEGK